MDTNIIKDYVENFFPNITIPALQGFIAIPNLSKNYDEDWDKNGNQVKAATYIRNWILSQKVKGLTCEILKDEGHTPFIFVEVAGTDTSVDNTIVLYGHMDKQPYGDGWKISKPTEGKISDDKKHLYGRGSSDDGYAVFGVITALRALQDNNLAIPRVILIIEGAEESDVVDLLYYVNILKSYIGNPKLIICLDSGCEDYERLWLTTSLRGVANIDMKVSVLKYGVHSGVQGGLAPDSFMIIRRLLDRIQDSNTGRILEPTLNVSVPDDRSKEIDNILPIVEATYKDSIPFVEENINKKALKDSIKGLIIANTWEPTLTITGADGFPESKVAGNVLRPFSTIKLSFRLPPTVNANMAVETISNILKTDVPYNAQIELKAESAGNGWNSKLLSSKLLTTLSDASKAFYGKNDLQFSGEGGSIPFVNTFSEMFEDADIAVMGVVGNDSNIHGPDENLNLDYCKKLIMSLTYLISKYA